MGARLTFGLVALAAITLALGFETRTKWIIYVSILCDVLAVVGLYLGSRRRRRQVRIELDETLAWTASLAEPARTESVAVFPGPKEVPVASSPGQAGRFAADEEPELEPTLASVTPYRARRALVPDVEVRPAPRPAVRPAAPAAAVRPAVRPAAPAAAVRPAAPAAAVRPAAAGRRRRVAPPVDAYPFPIEDYDYLGIADIVPLLPELDDDELVVVLLREQAGANRVAILNRIDALLEGED